MWSCLVNMVVSFWSLFTSTSVGVVSSASARTW